MKASIGVLTLLLTVGPINTALALSNPGATVATHHETIPNPVYNSTFRVASSCKTALSPCAWENPSTWVAGTPPDGNTKVIIDGNVSINSQSATALGIGIYPGGTLSFNPSANTRLSTGDIFVFEGGTLFIGTENQPIGNAFTAEVIIRDLPFDAADVKQHLRGIVTVNGTIKIHGRPLTETFIRTSQEPLANSATISLTISASEAGWSIGDTIAIPRSSQYFTAAGIPWSDETEEKTITIISSDGKTITLSSPLQFNHPGGRSSKGDLDFLPHILNKERNVIVRSENANGTRGHILLHGRASIDIRYARIQNLGRTDINNLGSNNQKGRYPLHAHHLVGPQVTPANGYQFTLLGNVIDFGLENYQQNRKWGIAIHGSHFGLIERNICDRASGAGIVTEDASETGNWFRKNFVLRIIGGNGARTEDRDPSDQSKLGRAGVGYWFNGGGKNFYENNVAAVVYECIYCYGYKFDNMYISNLVIPMSQGKDPYAGEGETADPYNIGITHFINNEAYAVPNGLTVWWLCTEFETPRDTCFSSIKNFQIWHHHRWGYFGYETNQMEIDGFKHRGDPRTTKTNHEQVVGILLGDYMTRRVIIRNADIQGAMTAIQMPTHRDIRGAAGLNIGFSTLEDSLLSAKTNIYIRAPFSNNGSSDLSPQTTIIRHVLFHAPEGHLKDIKLETDFQNVQGNPTLPNNIKTYDTFFSDSNNGNSLFIIPTYQDPSSCDKNIADCSDNKATSFPQILGAQVYSLLQIPPPPPEPLLPSSPSGLTILTQ